MGNQMTLGSLFDGIAGFPLAAVRHGIKPIWGSEIEADCVDITEKNFPDMEQLGDITELNPNLFLPQKWYFLIAPQSCLFRASHVKKLKER